MDLTSRIAPPAGLRGKRFECDGQEFAVLVFPLASAPAPSSALTEAERAVAALVLRGLSNEEIAALRRSSPRTIANQLQAIYRKLRITSRIELAQALAGVELP